MTAPRGRRLDAAVFSAAMVAFAVCAHRDGLVLPRFAALAVAAAAFARTIARTPRPAALYGLTRPRGRRLALLPLCVAFGAALAVWYRCAQGRGPLPGHLAGIGLLTAAIGLCEEAAYRGMVQGCLRPGGAVLAAAAAAAAHTAYKCGLFVLPDGAARANVAVLGVGTFAVGLVFALMRERLGGLAFPAAAHVAFDLVAYGDLAVVPWWVQP